MAIAWRVLCAVVVLVAAVLLVVDTVHHGGIDWGVVFALGVVIVVFGQDLGRRLWRKLRGSLL